MDGKVHCLIDMSKQFEISKINLMDKNGVSFVAHVWFYISQCRKYFPHRRNIQSIICKTSLEIVISYI